jgi:phosphotransferase system HPr-like phosphotransfer protein
MKAIFLWGKRKENTHMHQVEVVVPEVDCFRLASDVTHVASRSREDVEVYKFYKRTNAKSIMGLHVLGMKCDDTLYFKSFDKDILEDIKRLFGKEM